MTEKSGIEEFKAQYEKRGDIRAAYFRRRRIFLASIGTACFLILAGLYLYFFTDIIFGPPANVLSISEPGDWVMYAHDPGHTNNSGSQVLPSGKIKSIFSAGGPIHSSPIAVDGAVYFGSDDSRLYAVDAASGSLEWYYEADGWIQASPVIHDGTLYFGSNDGRLYALDLKSGQKKWDYKTRYAVQCSPAIVRGMVIFGSTDGGIYAIREDNGKVVWQANTGNWIVSSPVILNGVICVGSMDGYVYTVNLNDGRLRLQYNTFYANRSSPVADDTTFYFAGKSSLYALDPGGRNWPWESLFSPTWKVAFVYGFAPKPPDPSGLIWDLMLDEPIPPVKGAKAPAPKQINGSPVLSGGNIIVSMGDKLVAIDINQRKIIWTSQSQAAILTPPAVANGVIYAGSTNGSLLALDAVTGAQKWSLPIGESITTSPVVAGGKIFIGTLSGHLFIIE